MTSEAKVILSQLEKQTGDLHTVIQQQNKIEGLVQNQLDAIFVMDLFTSLKRQKNKNGLDSIKKQFEAIFYFEKNKAVLESLKLKENDNGKDR